MGFRMRKSKTIVPGVRISTTGKSASISFGGKAGRVTVNSSGRVTKTAHVPGTNVSYVSSSGGSHTAGHSSGKVSHAATKNTTAQNWFTSTRQILQKCQRLTFWHIVTPF